jgi:hypothetical protein
MKASSKLILAIILSLMMVVTHSASTQSFALLYNSSADPTTNKVYNPAYDLGVLEAGYTLTITISIPNLATSTAL